MVSADSHICEVPNLWTQRLPDSLRDRAPRIVRNFNGVAGDFFVCEGVPPRAIFAAFGAGVPPSELNDLRVRGFDAAPACVWSAAARIADQDADGIVAEVLYPTMADLVMGTEDPRLRLACLRAYNDFLAEYCAYDKSRLIGLALIDVDDVNEGAREIERCYQMGLRGIVLRADPSAEHGYDRPEMECIWTTAVDHNLPISVHRGALRRDVAIDTVGALLDYSMIFNQAQKVLAGLIFAGVLEKFPDLRLIFCEFDIEWLPHFVTRLDRAATKYGRPFGLSLQHLPSELLGRQVTFTFQEEVGEVARVLDALGENTVMWASDYPHADATWPRSREIGSALATKLGQSVARNLTWETCSKLYGIEVS